MCLARSLATFAGDKRQQSDVAGALDRDRYLALDPGRVAGPSAGKDLAPVIEAASQAGDILVIDDLVVVEDRLLPSPGRPPPTAARTPASSAATPLSVATTTATTEAAATARSTSGTARAASAARTTGATRPAKSGAWLFTTAVSFLVAGIRHSGLRSHLRRLVAATGWREWARRPERGIVHRTSEAGDSRSGAARRSEPRGVYNRCGRLTGSARWLPGRPARTDPVSLGR